MSVQKLADITIKRGLSESLIDLSALWLHSSIVSGLIA
jgi:hypothetical protein